MPAYLVLDLNLTDHKKFQTYAGAVQESVKICGGRYTCRWCYPERLEGEWQAHRIVMIEFPTVD